MFGLDCIPEENFRYVFSSTIAGKESWGGGRLLVDSTGRKSFILKKRFLFYSNGV